MNLPLLELFKLLEEYEYAYFPKSQHYYIRRKKDKSYYNEDDDDDFTEDEDMWKDSTRYATHYSSKDNAKAALVAYLEDQWLENDQPQIIPIN